MSQLRSTGPTRRTWVTGFAVITLVLLAGGYEYYRVETERIREEKYQAIAAIGEFKSGQIQEWRKDRLGDVTVLARGSVLTKASAELSRNAVTQSLRAELLERLNARAMAYGYSDALILAPDRHIVVAVKAAPGPVDPATERAITAALASREAVLSDFYRTPDGVVHIDAVAAVRDAKEQPLTVAVLRSDAEAYLYPLIQSWPTPSPSAETFIVQREGEEVVYLNDLRNRSKTALTLRVPLTRTEIPAVQAVLGKRGITQGKDYRDVAVLADLRPIPESPWFMVAKVDVDEILAEARDRTRIISLVVVLSILLSAAATAYAYRQRQVWLFRDLCDSERKQRESQEALHTMQHAAQQELSESEERLRMALAAANQAIFDIDIQTGESIVSPEYASMLGHDPAELRETYAMWRERLHPDDREDACRAYEEYAAGRRDEHRIEFRQRTKSGDWKWILSIGRLVSCSADGRPLRILGVHTDITERKRVEEASMASEQRYRLVLDHVDEVVYLVRMADGNPLEGTVEFVSSRVKGMLGHEPDEFLTDPALWFKSLHPEDVPAIEEATRKIFSAKTVGTRVFRMRHKTSGEYRWIEDRVAPRMDESGNVVGCFGAARDITERKRAEQALQELWRRLLRVQDEERRRIARELHDTTAQNLAALNMNLVLLEKAAPPDDARFGHLLADCQQLADHSAQEIRTLSYLLHPPLLDEFGLVRAMRDYAEGFSQRSGIRVELDAPEDPGRLPEDIEMALFRVLQEGLGNVHRHSGSPVARIHLARDDGQLRLEIRDEGVGLPPDLVNVKGSLGAAAGVGLLSMRERMQQLGGSLELETGLPGALVRVILPIKEPVR